MRREENREHTDVVERGAHGVRHFLSLVGLSLALLAVGALAANQDGRGMQDKRVEILVSVPDQCEGYSGRHPVTVGIPFPEGELAKSDGLEIVGPSGRPMEAQYRVTATWGPDSPWVRWLLVDFLAPIRECRAPKAFLLYGSSISAANMTSPLSVRHSGAGVAVRTGDADFEVSRDGGNIGRFALTDGTGKTFYAGSANGGRFEIAVEKSGAAVAVIKATGDYVAEDGTTLGQFVSRYRFSAHSAAVSIMHTLVWTEDDDRSIGALRFIPALRFAPAQVVTSVDGVPRPLRQDSRLNQVDWNRLEDSAGSPLGQQWDGWIAPERAKRSLFVGMRWPWQQHPTAASWDADGLQLQLIGPTSPLSMTAKDNLVMPVIKPLLEMDEIWRRAYFLNFRDLANNNGPYGHLSPRGMAKTYEVLLWPSIGSAAPPAKMKNLLLQHPVLAYPDPQFATRAGVPSPSTAHDPVGFPALEAAISSAFEWVAREEGAEGDYGLWNFGDAQYYWLPIDHPAKVNGYSLDRYWMNHGTGWSTVPWLLWLRSGDRRYREWGEANARHLMDVDTSHVTATRSCALPGVGAGTCTYKTRGGQTGYAPVHGWFSFANRPGGGPVALYFEDDSEYLAYSYYMSGYERAFDVLLERVEAVLSSDQHTELLRMPLAATDRGHYRALGEVLLLYEATWNAQLGTLANRYLDHILSAQAQDGWFPGEKARKNWFSHVMNLAHRALPDRRNDITAALTKWAGFVGDLKKPGVSGASVGPDSLWTNHTLFRATGDPHYRDVSALVARAQAQTVFQDAGPWLGLSIIANHYMGPAIRDWLAAMDLLANIPPQERPADHYAMGYFHAQLPASPGQQLEPDQWRSRHLFYVLDPDDRPAQIQLSFMAPVARKFRVNVVSPDGHLQSFASPSPADPNQPLPALWSYRVDLAPDGRRGAYLVEVLFPDTLPIPRPPLIAARSSTGKVVHYVPPAGTWTLGSSQFAGQVWFVPQPRAGSAASAVRLAFETSGPRAREPIRFVAFDPQRNVTCTTRIVGTEQGNPAYEPCSFSGVSSGLHSFVTANVDEQYRFRADGILPYVSSTYDEWFSPLVNIR